MHTLIVIQTHALFVSAQIDKQRGRLAGRQGRQTYAYTDTVIVIQTHALFSVHRQTNTQAGWQAGKEDGRMHTLIVILIQTHPLLVSAQTDKHTGGLAGRQGRQTYVYTNTDIMIQTHALHTPACGTVPASCVADVCSIFW